MYLSLAIEAVACTLFLFLVKEIPYTKSVVDPAYASKKPEGILGALLYYSVALAIPLFVLKYLKQRNMLNL
jgi:hypothetical protein